MNQKNINLAELAAAHARGHTDDELAALFRTSRSTIKRRRNTLGLGSNCPRNNVGKLAERLVAQHFTDMGLNALPAEGHQAPFDLLVNGWRVDVKVSLDRTTLRSGLEAVQFRLPDRRSSNMGQYVHHKDYQHDTDFFALAVLSGQELAYLYLLPVSQWQATVTVHPDSTFCPFQSYRDNLTLLRIPARAAA